jgi:hypothetical protein
MRNMHCAPAGSYVGTGLTRLSLRFEFSYFEMQVFILFAGLVTWVFPTGSLFDKGGKTFENERAKQSVVGSQLPDLKEYRATEQTGGFYPTVYFLRRCPVY